MTKKPKALTVPIRNEDLSLLAYNAYGRIENMRKVLDTHEFLQQVRAVDKEVTEHFKNDPITLLLWKINYANLTTGAPVPRTLLCSIRGVDKHLLQKLVKKGLLTEHRVKKNLSKHKVHRMDVAVGLDHYRHTEFIGYTIPDTVQFIGDTLYQIDEDTIATVQQKGLEYEPKEVDSSVAQGNEGAEDATSTRVSEDVQGARSLP